MDRCVPLLMVSVLFHSAVCEEHAQSETASRTEREKRGVKQGCYTYMLTEP